MSIRCKLFGHKYPWDAHQEKKAENKAAQYVCQRCRSIITRDVENALFTPNEGA